MNNCIHSTDSGPGIKKLPGLQEEAYMLMTIAFAAQLSRDRNPKTIYKYYCLTNQTLNPLNHENN